MTKSRHRLLLCSTGADKGDGVPAVIKVGQRVMQALRAAGPHAVKLSAPLAAALESRTVNRTASSSALQSRPSSTIIRAHVQCRGCTLPDRVFSDHYQNHITVLPPARTRIGANYVSVLPRGRQSQKQRIGCPRMEPRHRIAQKCHCIFSRANLWEQMDAPALKRGSVRQRHARCSAVTRKFRRRLGQTQCTAVSFRIWPFCQRVVARIILRHTGQQQCLVPRAWSSRQRPPPPGRRRKSALRCTRQTRTAKVAV